MTIKVLMFPHASTLQPQPFAGISRVVKEYFEYLPQFGIEMLPVGAEDKADLIAIHAGARGMEGLPKDVPIVSHCHGLYWTSDDRTMGDWTLEVNKTVINVIRHASLVTVPSDWVAQVFRRDMHLDPAIISHGVNWDEWQDDVSDEGYVLWGKNRASDACSPEAVNRLAERAPMVKFLTTYANPDPRPNIKITGTVDFATMKRMIKEASVYLAVNKETFGIQILEAAAAGKAILGFDWGGISEILKHGHNGFLAPPGDWDGLAVGLEYCLKHREILGRNSREIARHYTWEKACKLLADQCEKTVSAYWNERNRPKQIDPALYQRNVV